MKILENEGGGLLPYVEDERDILLGSVYTLPKLSELPKEYILPQLTVKNQSSTDFCTGFASCLASEYQEDVELEPSFSFMLSKIISGDPEAWGQTIKNAAQAHAKFGAIKKADSPYSIDTRDSNFLRKSENWGKLEPLLDKAGVHKKSTYLFISGPEDIFDNIKLTLWRFKDEERAIVFGTIWDSSWDTNTYVFNEIPKYGNGHAMAIVGFTEEGGKQYLVVQNSYGDNSNHGRHLFSREIINAMAGRYGAVMFVDIPPEVARDHQEEGTKEDQNILLQKLLVLLTLLRKFFGLQEETPPLAAVPSEWLLPAIIWQESNGDDYAKGDLNLVNKAFGPLQIRKPYIDDVNRRNNTHFKAESMLGNRKLSVWAFREYMKIYATEKRLGRPVTDQDLARITNGGPNGWKIGATLPYWYGVQNKLKLLQAGKVDPVLLKKIVRLV